MDPLLYGANEEKRIVAVHHGSDSSMNVYTRGTNGVDSTKHDFYPFFHLADESFLRGFQQKHWIKKLDGDHYFRYLCAFTRWSDMWDAVRQILEAYNASTSSRVESYSDLPVIHLRPDPVSQFLLQSGRTPFKGMTFDELHRMQLDIETYSQGKFSNANRPEDRITIIALSDNRGWKHAIHGLHLSEREMLEELVRLITIMDVDVIEGHNIFNFDIPYIMRRAEMLGVTLALGRDGSLPRIFDTRASFAERPVDYTAIEIAGRHIIDTWLLLQAYDVSKRTLDSYGLKSAAKHFGFASDDRIYIQPERIAWYWDHEPDLLIRYAMDDVLETRLLSETLAPPYYYLAQMLPFNYGSTARIGSSAKIESLLAREYIRQRQSLPKPEPGAPTTGGYTDIFHTGILGPIVDVDVESLYPTLMLSDGIAPVSERLGIFLPLLRALTSMRLDAKRRMKSHVDPNEKLKLDAMQSSFKILINSFYGYLGYNRALFNDMSAAEKVTQGGQRILRQLIDAIETKGGTVVEVDTDGIYFVPPPRITTPEEEEALVRDLASRIPSTITLVMNGRYESMLSYKKKNYALLGYNKKIRVKGSSLNSRSIEKFGRHFVLQCIEALLNLNIPALHSLYVNLYHDIGDRKLSIADFARTETLKETPEEYRQAVQMGSKNRAASYEAALSSGMSWRVGDRISYYIVGADPAARGFEHCKAADDWDPDYPDENIQFYQRRLEELAAKFEPFFTPKDFAAIFSMEDLFGFSPEGMRILTRRVEHEKISAEEITEGAEGPDPKIWLDNS